MGVTFAANGVYLGMAAGALAGLATKSAPMGIVVAIGASVACWYGIRAIETLLGRGVNAGITAVSNRMSRPQPTGGYPPPSQYGPPPPHGQQPSGYGQQQPPQARGYLPPFPPAPHHALPPQASNSPYPQGQQPWA